MDHKPLTKHCEQEQESSSEDAMAAYAMKMWGMVSGDGNMAARGNLMLAVLRRSLSDYYLYTMDNKVQPANFIANKVAGILFENKVPARQFAKTRIETLVEGTEDAQKQQLERTARSGGESAIFETKESH